jgi:hypothetical protein
MALPASDNFNRADSTSLGANWTEVLDNAEVKSNAFIGNVGGGITTIARWTADAFNADQKAQCLVPDNYGGPCARVQSNGNGYWALYGSSASTLYRVDGGTGALTSLGALTSGTNITARIEAEGTTIRVYRNGTLDLSVTDSNYASGAAGIGNYFVAVGCDDWTADNLAAAASPFFTRLGAQRIAS